MSINRLALLMIILMGIGCLTLSLMSPWHEIPFPSWDLVEAPSTLYFKCVLGVGGVLYTGLVVLSIGFQKGFFRLKMAVLLMTLQGVLVFPYTVLNHDPVYSGQAAWLQQQFDTLTWLGGDIYKSHSERYEVGASSLNAQDLPFRLSAYRPPDQGVLSFGISDWQDWNERIGYGALFAQFMKKGWALACLGLILLSIGQAGWDFSKKRPFQPLTPLFLGLVSVSIVIGLIMNLRIQTASRSLSHAKERVLDGEFSEARVLINRACESLPSLQFDTGVIIQKGFLDSCLHRETAYQDLYEAYKAGKRGLKQQAEFHLRAVSENPSIPPSIERERERMIMHLAIDAMNSGKQKKAEELLTYVLQRNSSGLLAHFHLQLLALRRGAILENREHQAAVETLLKSFQRKEKRAVLATTDFTLAQGEYAAGNVQAASVARKKSRGYGR